MELQGNASKCFPDRDSDSADGADVILSSSIYHCVTSKGTKTEFHTVFTLGFTLEFGCIPAP